MVLGHTLQSASQTSHYFLDHHLGVVSKSRNLAFSFSDWLTQQIFDPALLGFCLPERSDLLLQIFKLEPVLRVHHRLLLALVLLHFQTLIVEYLLLLLQHVDGILKDA